MRNRIRSIRKNIDSFKTNEELRLEILNALDDKYDLPEVGQYYTFLHLPDKKIKYDNYPLVATMKMEDWGFGGLNFHSKKYNSYNWNSVKSKYHLIRKNELEDLIDLKYSKLHLNK